MPASPEERARLELAGLSKEQIDRLDAGEAGQTLAPTGAAPAPPEPKKRRAIRNPFIPGASLVAQGQDLSSLLAMPGGFLPGHAGRGLSALGGATGELLQELAMGQTPNLQSILEQARNQALLTMGGQLLGGTSRAIGTGAMKLALRPNIGTIRQAPGVAVDALEQGATVRTIPGVGTKLGGGIERARQVAGERGAVTVGGLDRAAQKVHNVPGVGKIKYRARMNAMMPSVKDLVNPRSAERDKEVKLAKDVIKNYVHQHPGPHDPVALKEYKQELFARAKAIFAEKNKGTNLQLSTEGIPTSPDVPIESRVYLGAAHKIDKYLKALPEGVVGIKGGITASEKATQKSIGVVQAIKDATDRAESGLPSFVPQGFGRGSMVAGGAYVGQSQGGTPEERIMRGGLGALTGAALGDPAVTSRLAQLLYQQYLTPAIARQVPRAGFMMFNDGSMPPDTLDDESR